MVLITFLCFVLFVRFLSQKNTQIFDKTANLFMDHSRKVPQHANETTKTLRTNMEVVIRMPVAEKFIKRIFCDVLRSSSIMWNSTLLGDFLLILDESDRAERGPHLMKSLSTLQPVHKFRIVYEKEPNNKNGILKAGKQMGKSYGYMLQLLSSFFMDMYTTKSIIAWLDTDIIFSMPVVAERVINEKGQLRALGINQFKKFSWVSTWDYTATLALGFPLISDFMTYFPVFVYVDTITNCRKFIMRRFGTNNFEEAFLKFSSKFVSPVSIIMNYAYHFENERYEWHFDLDGMTLDAYNKDRKTFFPVLPMDIVIEPHVSVHSGYYKQATSTHEQAICYTEIYLGKTDLAAHCEVFRNTKNSQPYEFCNTVKQGHLDTWWKYSQPECIQRMEYYYGIFVNKVRSSIRSFDTSIIRRVEDIAKKDHGVVCSPIRL